MKKILIAAVLTTCFLQLAAQNIQIMDTLGADVTGDTVTVNGDGSEFEITLKLDVIQSSGASMNMRCDRFELETADSSYNYFCWDVCYVAKLSGTECFWPAVNWVPLPDTTKTSLFSIYHQPNGQTGEAFYKVMFYDDNDPTDSARVFVKYDIPGPAPHACGALAGIKSRVRNDFEMWPNPANSRINFKLNNLGSSYIKLTNVLGTTVMVVKVNSNRSSLDVSKLRKGIYFATLVTDSKPVATQRVIISR